MIGAPSPPERCTPVIILRHGVSAKLLHGCERFTLPTLMALSGLWRVECPLIYLFIPACRIMSMTPTNASGQDDCCRKRSAMIMQGLIVGGIVCVVLLALVGGLHYGTAGHSAPSGHTRGRQRGPLRRG